MKTLFWLMVAVVLVLAFLLVNKETGPVRGAHCSVIGEVQTARDGVVYECIRNSNGNGFWARLDRKP